MATCEVGQVGGAKTVVGVPVLYVVGFAPVDRGGATGKGAAAVADGEGPLLGAGGEADVEADVERRTVGVHDQPVQHPFAGQAAHGRRRQRLPVEGLAQPAGEITGIVNAVAGVGTVAGVVAVAAVVVGSAVAVAVVVVAMGVDVGVEGVGVDDDRHRRADLAVLDAGPALADQHLDQGLAAPFGRGETVVRAEGPTRYSSSTSASTTLAMMAPCSASISPSST